MNDFDPEFDKLPDQPVTIGGDKNAAAGHGAERDAMEAKEAQWREASRLLRERTGQLSLVETERDALAHVIEQAPRVRQPDPGQDWYAYAVEVQSILQTAPAVSLALHDAEVKAQALDEAAEAFATGEWSDAFAAGGVEDDVSAVQATEAWFKARAAAIRQEAGQ